LKIGGMFWLKSEPIFRKIPTLNFSPPPQAAGWGKPVGSRAKNPSPKTPSFFARSPKGKIFDIINRKNIKF